MPPFSLTPQVTEYFLGQNAGRGDDAVPAAGMVGPQGWSAAFNPIPNVANLQAIQDMPTALDGAFKVPNLRNVTLTAPFFHNGGQLTLRQVVEFYNRGGDFAIENLGDLAPNINPLGLNEQQILTDLVAFLEALTDERVRCELAPFDHPGNPHRQRRERLRRLCDRGQQEPGQSKDQLETDPGRRCGRSSGQFCAVQSIRRISCNEATNQQYDFGPSTSINSVGSKDMTHDQRIVVFLKTRRAVPGDADYRTALAGIPALAHWPTDRRRSRSRIAACLMKSIRISCAPTASIRTRSSMRSSTAGRMPGEDGPVPVIWARSPRGLRGWLRCCWEPGWTTRCPATSSIRTGGARATRAVISTTAQPCYFVTTGQMDPQGFTDDEAGRRAFEIAEHFVLYEFTQSVRGAVNSALRCGFPVHPRFRRVFPAAAVRGPVCRWLRGRVADEDHEYPGGILR